MFRVIASSFILFIIFCQVSTGEVISDEQKALIDQMVELQGANFVDEEIAVGLASQVQAYYASLGVAMDEGFYETLISVVSEAVFEEYIVTGDLAEFHYQVWGEYFESNEILALIEFYKSPLGKKLLNFAPLMNERTTAAMIDLQTTVGPILEKRMLERLSKGDLDLSGLLPSAKNAVGNRELFPVVSPPSTEELAELAEEKCIDPDASSKRIPIYRGPPVYPRVAAEHELHGSVDLSFTINPDGSTSDVRVYNSSNGTVFDRAAIAAASNYLYCPGKKVADAEIRVVFEMEGQSSRKQEIKRPLTKKSDALAFMQSERFVSDVNAYAERASRKAYAVASDASGAWVSSWRFGHRTQDDANSYVLADCENQRRARKIKDECKIVLIGHELTEAFKSSPSLVQLVDTLDVDGYKPMSHFETYLENYYAAARPKALAMIDQPDGAYFLGHAYGMSTQAKSNKSAIDECNKGKPIDFYGDCQLYMVGEYRLDDVPKLTSMKGIWMGKINDRLIGSSVDESAEGPLEVRLDNCGVSPAIAMRVSEQEEFTDLARMLDVTETAGNVILSSVLEGDGWVETQIWSFIDLQNDTVKVQQNRMVSNVELALDDPKREFGYLGAGSLTRLDTSCDEPSSI